MMMTTMAMMMMRMMGNLNDHLDALLHFIIANITDRSFSPGRPLKRCLDSKKLLALKDAGDLLCNAGCDFPLQVDQGLRDLHFVFLELFTNLFNLFCECCTLPRYFVKLAGFMVQLNTLFLDETDEALQGRVLAF